jgi:RNA polymerase sigma-70 factor, ECF subfamily
MDPRDKTPGEGAACSDAELIRRLKAGEQAPLGELFLRYGRLVRSVVTRAFGASGADIDDVVQDVFLTLYENAPRYAETGKLRAYLCAVAVRKVRARLRRHWWRHAILERFAGRTPGAAAMVESSMDTDLNTRDEVRQALAVLPDPQRQVLLLHVVENMSGEEIAVALGISPNTVWTRLHRARERMRRALGAELVVPDPEDERS